MVIGNTPTFIAKIMMGMLSYHETGLLQWLIVKYEHLVLVKRSSSPNDKVEAKSRHSETHSLLQSGYFLTQRIATCGLLKNSLQQCLEQNQKESL